MDYVLILLIALPFFLWFLFKNSKNTTTTLSLPPGPKGLPIIGNLHQIESNNPHRFLYNLSKIYGPIMSLTLGSKRFVVISSAKLAKDVLKTQDHNFCTRASFYGQQKMSYNGQDIAFGKHSIYWREMRKLCITHLFSASRVDSFRPVRSDEVSRTIETIANAAMKSQIVDMDETMMSFTNSVVCRVALGKRYNEYGWEMKRFIEVLYETQAMFRVFFFADYFPRVSWLDMFNGSNARLENAAKQLDEFLQGIVDEHLELNREKPETKSLVDVLLQICNDPSFSIKLTGENVKAITMDLVVAGTDTATSVVVWAMTYLIKYPRVMKKIQEEIRVIAGTKGYVTEEDITKLPYLKAVVKETLRLQPVMLLHREAIQDCTVGGYTIPAKTIVQVIPWSVSRDVEVWGENPEEFYPERFIDDKCIDFKGQDFEFLPFGSGRRMCPGMQMGVAMLELPLANFLYKFDWELPKGVKAEEISMDVMTGLAMLRKEHLMLIPKKYVPN